MKKVNNYTIPETRGNVSTRAGAEKRIRQVYEANKDAIDARIYEEAAARGGRPPKDMFAAFKNNVMGNLSSKYGGDNEYNKLKKNGRLVEEHLRINQALEKTLNNSLFTPYKNRARMNLLNHLRKTDRLNILKIERELGRSLTYNDIEYLADNDTYAIMVGNLYYAITHENGGSGRYGFQITSV